MRVSIVIFLKGWKTKKIRKDVKLHLEFVHAAYSAIYLLSGGDDFKCTCLQKTHFLMES